MIGQEGTRTEMQEQEETPVGELDVTPFELAQSHGPKYELFGNQIHELHHNGGPERELVGDSPPK